MKERKSKKSKDTGGADVSSLDAFVGFFVLDILIPIRRLYGIASRESFRKLRQEGLKVYKVANLGVCVRPSDLKKFLDEQAIIE